MRHILISLFIVLGIGGFSHTSIASNYDDYIPSYPNTLECYLGANGTSTSDTLNCYYYWENGYNGGTATGQVKAASLSNFTIVKIQNRFAMIPNDVCGRQQAFLSGSQTVCWHLNYSGSVITFTSIGAQTDTDGDAWTNANDPDDDNDGMPDVWENSYGLNPLVNDANGDPDGDGFTNLQEFTNGTNPTVANFASKLGRISNFDGLNKTDDLVLTGPDVQVWTTANNIVSHFNYLDALPESGNALLVATPDVNRDGINDMVFQINGGGNIYTWVMGSNGTAKTANWLLSTNALVKGSGDFDGDGDGDLVLQDPATGDVSVLLLQNGQVAGYNWLGTFAYTVKAVGDINNDGTDDIILQDASYNIATLTISNGHLVQATWQEQWPGRDVIGMGDANGDGTQDIYTNNNGDLAVIPMANGHYSGGYWLGTFTGYTPYAIADVDGDGLSDYVMQDISGNIATVTLTNTFAVKLAQWIGNWSYRVKGALDTDGDLDADIVIQDGSGNVGIIEMENGVNVASRWIANTANTVTILPKTAP